MPVSFEPRRAFLLPANEDTLKNLLTLGVIPENCLLSVDY